MIERCYVINMDRSVQRRLAFAKNVAAVDWPLPRPERFVGVDEEPPPQYRVGRGAWGCLRSHLDIYHHCICEGVESVAIFEDDAVFPADFGEQFDNFMAAVPNDWQQVYLCGNHSAVPEVVNSQVLRCTGTNVTAGYLLRRGGLSKVHAFLASVPGVIVHPYLHIDVIFATLHKYGLIRAYAPWRSMVGQRAGPSDRARVEGNEYSWDHDEFFPLPSHVLRELEAVC